MTRDRDARSSKPRPRPEGTKGRAWWGNSCDVLAESDDRRRSCLSTKEKNFWSGWVVRQRIRLPCTTPSTPLDFNLGAGDRRAEGNSFTFQ